MNYHPGQVFVYASDCRGVGVEELYKLFLKSWTRYGWDVIRIQDVWLEECYRYSELTDLFKSYPTVNGELYERACLIRHAYMAIQGGFVCDVDVLNYGFTPEDFPDYTGMLCLDPCIGFYGPPEGYRWIVDEILRWQVSRRSFFQAHGKPHFSDMHVYQELKVPRTVIGANCGVGDWKTAKLVHFSADYLGTHVNKHLAIQEKRPV